MVVLNILHESIVRTRAMLQSIRCHHAVSNCGSIRARPCVTSYTQHSRRCMFAGSQAISGRRIRAARPAVSKGTAHPQLVVQAKVSQAGGLPDYHGA